MISADCQSAQPISSLERNSWKKPKPRDQQNQKLSDIKAGTFVSEPEDEEEYNFDSMSDD